MTDVDPVLKEYRATGAKELPILRESDAQYYFREERLGWILGPYEKGAPACFVDGVPLTFEKDLFEGDLERLMPHVEAAMARVPSFENAGIKDIVNGPISYTPDGNPMVGPAFGLENFWLSEGHSFGVTAAGGAGWQLAEWMVEGEPTVDMIGVDPRRFGVVSKNYAKIKNEEAYEHVFINHFPMEERGAARPAKTPPCYGRLQAAGAVFGQRFGWERPNWFAPQGVEGRDVYSFRRSNWFEHVGNEVRTMREQAGLLELSAFTKIEIEGSGARAFLDGIVANNIPKKVGGISLAHALNPSGPVRSEFTITKLEDGLLGERFFLISGGGGPRLRPRLPAEADAAGRLGASARRHHAIWRLRLGRAKCPNDSRAARRCGYLQRGFPLVDRPRNPDRLLPEGAGSQGQLRGLARLGAASSDRVSEPPL